MCSQSVCAGPVSLPRGDQCPVSLHLGNKDGKMNNANLFFGKKAKVHLFILVFNFRDVLVQYTHSYILFFERIIVRCVYCPLKAMVRREEK